jgi:hypothetical protein
MVFAGGLLPHDPLALRNLRKTNVEMVGAIGFAPMNSTCEDATTLFYNNLLGSQGLPATCKHLKVGFCSGRASGQKKYPASGGLGDVGGTRAQSTTTPSRIAACISFQRHSGAWHRRKPPYRKGVPQGQRPDGSSRHAFQNRPTRFWSHLAGNVGLESCLRQEVPRQNLITGEQRRPNQPSVA